MSNAIKVYETSIVPPGGRIEPIRSHKTIASSTQIEVLHIAVFVGVLFFIFGGLWKAAKATKKSTVYAGELAPERSRA